MPDQFEQPSTAGRGPQGAGPVSPSQGDGGARLFDPDAIIRFGGGEPTILPEFEKLVHYFLEVDRRFFINSSGVKYSLAIDRMLRSGRAGSRLVISIDSATDETYEIIKGLDLGRRVWDNIARYAPVEFDFLEVKYIVLPENAHETAAFVKRCHDIGVKRVSIDLDSRPIIFDIKNSLTDEIIEGIAVLIYEAKRKGMSVYHSGSGYALWEQEDGERRVNAAIARLSGGRFTVKQLADGFLELAKIPQDLIESLIVDWGRCENVTAAPLNSEPWAIYLQEELKLRPTSDRTDGHSCCCQSNLYPGSRGAPSWPQATDDRGSRRSNHHVHLRDD